MKMKKYIVILLAISLLLVTTSLASGQYNDSFTDSTGDVWYYQYTETKFQWKEGVERPDIDITRVEVSESGNTITVSLRVKGTISNRNEVVYEISLEDENEDTYQVLFTGGQCYLEGPNSYMMLEASGVGTSTLETSVSLSEINNPSSLDVVEAYSWDWIDAEGEGEYYYDVAGPEATSPTGSSNGDDSSGEITEEWLDRLLAGSLFCIALGVIIPIIILVVIIVLIFKLLKSDEDKGQHPSQQYQQQPQQYQQPPPEQQQEQTPPSPDESGESSSTPPPPEDEGDSKNLPPPPPEDE